jgi:hypothetical protein
MRKRMKAWMPMVALAALCSGQPLAAEPIATKDLTSTIALLGLPCGQVVSAKQQGQNDYIATCSNKMRYRVYMNAQGRVVAEKQ